MNAAESRYATSQSLTAVFNCDFVNEPREVAFPVEVTAPVRFALVVTVAAFPVTEPEIAFVTVKSVNQPFAILVQVEPICPDASVARMEADAPGAEEDVTAWVWAVAVELVEETVSVPGVAMVVAKLPVPLPVTAPVRVMVWSPVLTQLFVPVMSDVKASVPDASFNV